MTRAWAVMPSLRELREEMALPATELGPWEWLPLARLAMICAGDAICPTYSAAASGRRAGFSLSDWNEAGEIFFCWRDGGGTLDVCTICTYSGAVGFEWDEATKAGLNFRKHGVRMKRFRFSMTPLCHHDPG